jgi:hypothetical protein
VSAPGSVRIGSRGVSGSNSGAVSGSDSKGSVPKAAAHASDCAPLGGLAVRRKRAIALIVTKIDNEEPDSCPGRSAAMTGRT